MAEKIDRLRETIYTALGNRDYIAAGREIARLTKLCPEEGWGLTTAMEIEQGHADKALSAWQKLAALMPQDVYTLFLRARIHHLRHEYASALVLLEPLTEQALPPVYGEKIYNLLGQCHRFLGEVKESAAAYLMAVKSADNADLARMEYSNYLFNLHYQNLPLKMEKAAAEGYNEFFSQVRALKKTQRNIQQDILHIGYVSPDLRNHVTAGFVYDLIVQADKKRFCIYIYSSGPVDTYSQQFAAAAVWRDICGLEAEETAKIIQRDHIDILVDLAGHGKGNSLPVFAYKPAPIQISGIGYFASTGLATMDYFLSDRHLAADGAQAGFTEKLLILPHSHFCYTPKKAMHLPDDLPVEKNVYITFGSFNNFSKVNDEVLAVWAEILRQVPDAHLLLKAEVFSYPESSERAKEKIAAAGIALSRVECRGVSQDYMAEYADMDIALDTFPYPGGGTSCDALYMGVPLVTLAGKSHGSRFGLSFMANLDLAELCAADKAGYIERAVMLAGDRQLLGQLHRTLRQKMESSYLMNGEKYVAEVEEAYEKVWHDYLLTKKVPVIAEWESATAKALDRGQLSRSALLLRLIDKHYGKNAYHSFLQAVQEFQGGEDDTALITIKTAISSGELTKLQLGAAYNLLANIHKKAGRRKEAAEAYRKSADYKDLSTGKLVDYSNYLLNMAFFEEDRKKNYQAALGYGKLLAEISPLPESVKYQHKKLRIGYMSADFNHHVMACFMQMFFKDYDKNIFQVYGYSLGKCDDLTAMFQENADVWRNIGGMSAEEAARIIRADEIDILVDLGGHTAGSGLPIMAYKPVPVQISGIGYFATTGLSAVDYFWVDKYTAQNGEEQYFTEKLLRLPHSHLCWQPLPEMPSYLSPLPGQRNGYITFGCLNQWDKVTDEVLSAWAQILEKLPQARLLLKAGVFDIKERRQRELARMAEKGVDTKRVIIEGRSEDYLLAYLNIDIALDTFPYPGGGTTCDALYMGVPVIALQGNSHHSRFGCSLLANAGLAETCVAASWEEYVSKAVELAKNDCLPDIRQNLRRRLEQTPVMNGKLYMRDIENVYLKLWAESLEQSKQSLLKNAPAIAEKFYQEQNWPELINFASKVYVAAENKLHLPLARFLAFAYYQQNNHIKTCYWARKALDIANDPQMGYLEASALDQLGELSKAIALAEKYLSDKGALPAEIYKLFCHLRSVAAYKLGHPEMSAFYWQSYLVDRDINMYSSYLLTFNCREITEKELYQKSKEYGNLLSNMPQFSHNAHKKHKKLRIGYISPDFRLHVMYKFYQVLLGGHSNDFTVYAYSLTTKRDEYTALCARMADVWCDIGGKTVQEAADIIYRDEIDILIDLAGHTAGGSLPIMAYKPAPIQISGLGYMATTGLPAVDYFLTDTFVDPPGCHDEYFTEKLVRLQSQFCYTPEINNLPASSGAPCKDRGWVLFGVFNAYRKFTEEMLTVWQEILTKTANSKILFKCQVFFSPAMQEEAYKRLQRAGFDMERVIFEPAVRNYMERYLDVDIALDTYPYPGGGTTCDALYMGVPVVSLYSNRHSTRFSHSILHNIGLGELAVDNRRDYVERAVALAEDRELLDILHKGLRRMMEKSPLMDRQAYMADLEKHYRELWQTYDKGEY